jgi:hypothetical protein
MRAETVSPGTLVIQNPDCTGHSIKAGPRPLLCLANNRTFPRPHFVSLSVSTRTKPEVGGWKYQRMFTARAASSATIVRDINDCSIMPSFAKRDSTAVSVGEKAVLVLNARNR